MSSTRRCDYFAGSPAEPAGRQGGHVSDRLTDSQITEGLRLAGEGKTNPSARWAFVVSANLHYAAALAEVQALRGQVAVIDMAFGNALALEGLTLAEKAAKCMATIRRQEKQIIALGGEATR